MKIVPVELKVTLIHIGDGSDSSRVHSNIINESSNSENEIDIIILEIFPNELEIF